MKSKKSSRRKILAGGIIGMVSTFLLFYCFTLISPSQGSPPIAIENTDVIPEQAPGQVQALVQAKALAQAQVSFASVKAIRPLGQASPGLPVRLKIPKIRVNAVINSVGLTPQGAVGVPKNPSNAAWYNLGPRPGEIGSSVITGHLNWYNGATGVFANLSKLKKGDKITVQDDNGALISYVVREVRSYDASAKASDVFSSSDGKAHLNLITCIGVWDRKAKQYTKRLVVFADREIQ